jgi:hypothetical protein
LFPDVRPSSSVPENAFLPQLTPSRPSQHRGTSTFIMAFANLLRRPDRAEREDDGNDHIDSDTPRSGIATPQPDPSDKRFPSINSGYFPQVGTCSIKTPTSGLPKSLAHTGRDETKDTPYLQGRESMVDGDPSLSVAPGLTAEAVDAHEKKHEEIPPLSSSNGMGNLQAQAKSEKDAAFHSYPTPPDSKTPSLHKLKLNESGSEDDVEVKRPTTSSSLHHKSISDSIPQHARRPSLLPLSSIVTTSNVLAAHFSNPTDTNASTPILSRLTSQFHESPSIEKLKKLTDDFPAEKSGQVSPRALSTVTAKSDASAGSELAKKENEHHATNSTEEKKEAVGAAIAASAPAPVTKGKLTIKISEARGIKRSREPYVVAVFQRNELVSKGPIPEDSDEEDHKDVTSSPMGGIPISRTGSDSGRPRAIPMKSRQSSNTSLSDYRDFKMKGRKSFTNPKWDTEAVL